MPSTAVTTSDRRGFFITFTVLLAVWAAVLLTIAITLIPNGYWYSYFVIDYRVGFVRRGLAGEILGLFGPQHYFGGLLILRWMPTALFVLGLAAVAWSIAVRAGRSERRRLLALLIAVLPFGFAFALFSARTDALGGTALVGFAIALTKATTTRARLIISAVFGLVLGVLSLIHEATPFLFGLGALAALTVLADQLCTKGFRACVVLALGPSILVALALTAFGKTKISPQLCQMVQHFPMNHPLAGKPTIGQLLSGFHYYVDYHDWYCRAFLPLFDMSLVEGLRFVGGIGVVALAGSTVYGIVTLVISMLAIGHVAGVPVSRFTAVLQSRPLAMMIGVVMILPVFATGVDWVRWWVIIAFDLGIVFLLYTRDQPEVDEPPTRRTLVVFAVGTILLAVIPIGIIPGFGAPVPM
ncbi:hypothetical protein FHT40_006433 [Mycolicibacterium sp. BK556]|uniref:hypothetical protein n=1 Tax=unclassified Mycolicibacterium TaxID=2636767 RepID=UPI0016112024|nr:MULTISPECIES: hypothetical protein [unclassified Mycolicibacterium]MBB3606740.1 hypothetical protein [Mycolicibacterium sp. BK556]MBB3636594.1 hypothetical protein [Mycolicibacterium sp. BK607]MBB3754320.1 hypothetical protein [Mycolicibacterium sp. BK634]